jgi:hypothetical protein
MKVFDCLGTYVKEFYIEHIAFYQDMFTIHLDGMGPSTRVYVVRCAWAPATVSYLIR